MGLEIGYFSRGTNFFIPGETVNACILVVSTRRSVILLVKTEMPVHGQSLGTRLKRQKNIPDIVYCIVIKRPFIIALTIKGLIKVH